MPIIESAAHELPLSQGDVLKDIKLFRTDIESNSQKEGKAQFSLVLSRPCVTAHKRTITVAAIEKYAPNIPGDVETFEDMRAFLTDTRDGLDAPDVLYLGSLPGQNGRFAARLEQMHTIVISDGMTHATLVERHRIAKLNEEFRRDLHLRIFRAFASLGFDDIGWYSDDDLTSLVKFADLDISKLQTEIAQQKAKSTLQEMRGTQHSAKQLQPVESRLSALMKEVAPFRQELARRTQS